MPNAYFDPRAILAEDTLTSVELFYGVAGLGLSLDPGCTTADLPERSKVELPLWLVQALKAREFVQIELPQVYKEKYREKCEAGAECLNFNRRAPFFYDVGSQHSELSEDTELEDFLRRTFVTRYERMLCKSLTNSSTEELLLVASKLSAEERQVYEEGREGTSRLFTWWNSSSTYRENIARKLMFKRRRLDGKENLMNVLMDAATRN